MNEFKTLYSVIKEHEAEFTDAVHEAVLNALIALGDDVSNLAHRQDGLLADAA